MITCLFVGGILTCEIIKTVIIVKAAKAVKNLICSDEEETKEN